MRHYQHVSFKNKSYAVSICQKHLSSPNMSNLLHDPRPEWTKSMHITSQVNNRKHTSEQKEDVPGHFKFALTCQKGYCSIVTCITSSLKCRWY